MEFFLVAAFFAFFICLAWVNFRYAVCLLLLLLPGYLIRFNLGPLPSTLLEISFGSIALVWLVRYFRSDWEVIKSFFLQYRALFALIFIFFFASLIAAFANPIPLKALGIWRAYFLEPIILFLILIGRHKEIPPKDLLKFLAWSSVGVSLMAIIQKITGHFYPPSLWDDQLFGRPTSFFTTPNAIGLYLVPILILLAPAAARIIQKKREPGDWWMMSILLAGVLAVLLSFSQGAWAAIVAGLIVFGFLFGQRRLTASVLVIIIFTLALAPNIRNAFLFQDQAGQNRLTLWKYSTEYLTKTPTNFILGSGLRRFFTEVQQPYYNVQEMERLIYPHNIFLNFWLETGLLGVLSFVGILIYLFYLAANIFKKNRLFGAAIAGALTAFAVHGLVDVPYFKNDLAMIFWIITAAIVIIASNLSKEKTAS
ncbi:MAG: O-antigen ligase family protein [Candidatus Magasanikbacteria bacterium]|nr:O-antigen ligase family protein [Candidatus Magasanikbacteria bacterium]